MKITLQMDAREPKVYFVEYHAVGKSHSAEELCLSNFKETNIGSVKNDPGCVDIAPTDAFFNRETFRARHCKFAETQLAGLIGD
jgi:hypothetical protein